LGLWLAKLGGADEDLLSMAWRYTPSWARQVLQTAISITPDALNLRDEARRVCGFIEESSAEGTSGEWKRHRALATLKKIHPKRATRDIALAIELIMPFVKGTRAEWTS